MAFAIYFLLDQTSDSGPDNLLVDYRASGPHHYIGGGLPPMLFAGISP
jgi:hypothetical protein